MSDQNPQYSVINYGPFNISKEYIFNEGEPKNLASLDHINMFIGPNSSGKSRFLRSLFNQESYQYWPSHIDKKTIHDAALTINNAIESVLKPSLTRTIYPNL